MPGPLIDDLLRTAKDVGDSREVIHLLFAANVRISAQGAGLIWFSAGRWPIRLGRISTAACTS